MKQSRKLVLRSQRVTDLATDELAAIVGGTHAGCAVTHGGTCEQECNLFSNPVNECLPAFHTITRCLFVTSDGCE